MTSAWASRRGWNSGTGPASASPVRSARSRRRPIRRRAPTPHGCLGRRRGRGRRNSARALACSCRANGAQAPAIPLSAVQRGADGASAVWVVDPATHTLHARPVRLGAFGRRRRAGARGPFDQRLDRHGRRPSAARRPVGCPVDRDKPAGAGQLRARRALAARPSAHMPHSNMPSANQPAPDAPAPGQPASGKRGFNLSEWALRNAPWLSTRCWCGVVGAWSYRHLGQSGGSAVHLQGHGGADAVAGRDAGEVSGSHRAHRKAADDDGAVRVIPRVLAPRRVASDLHGTRLDAIQRHPAVVVSGAQEDRRRPCDPARRGDRPVLQ